MKRPWQITNEEHWLDTCEKIVRAARGVLDGSLGITEGARLLSSLGGSALAEEDDEDFVVFTGIFSETMAFPIGDVRSRWSAEALARSDAERAAVEALWRDRAEKAAKNLVEKYDNAA